MGDPNSPNRVRQNFLGKETGSNATVGRMLNASGPKGPTLASLDDVAAYFKLKPWQLLVEGLDPQNPPILGKKDEALEVEFRRRVVELLEEMGIERRTHH